MEIKFVAAFLDNGVSWGMIHKARDKAAERFPNETHPFCTQRFLTDGRQIFVELLKETGETSLIQIADSQQVFAQIIRPFIKELEFGPNNALERWWPLGKDRCVAVDPRRNFGQPSVFERGIPTRVLARSVKANAGSVEIVADWYAVSPKVVKEAVEYEHQLAA